MIMKIKSNVSKRVISLLLSAGIICGMVGASAYAVDENSAAGFVGGSSEAEKVSSNNYLTISSDEEEALGKEETVYVMAGADGSANKIIVSAWLKNPGGVDFINDVSELENIVNVKGDEDYTKGEGNEYVWNANGRDIYYQGTTDKKLPIDMRVSYKLDGEDISADELAGKSGKVAIRFDYINNKKEKVEIDGKEEEIYVPFLTLTGTILNNDVFTNVEISNGKLLNDGDKSIAIVFAMPGMQENLNIDKEKFEIPSYVEITADVKEFELTTTLTVALNDAFNHLEISDEENPLDGLSKSLDELSSASNRLINGSSALYDGLGVLLEKSGALVSGVDKLSDGAADLKDGAYSLSDGAYSLKGGAEQIQNGAGSLKDGAYALNEGMSDLCGGASKLNEGLGTLSSKGEVLKSGAAQVFESLLRAAASQIAAAGIDAPELTIDNYKSVLNGVVSSIDRETVYNKAYKAALEKVSAGVYSEEAKIRLQVESIFRARVLEEVLKSAGYSMSAEDYAAAVSAGSIPETVAAAVEAGVAEQMKNSSIKEQINATTEAKIKELIETNMKGDAVVSQINAAVESAESGVKSIKALIAQLDSYNEFYKGVAAYTSGVADAYNGSSALVSGSKNLLDGSSALAKGAADLLDGVSSLSSGAAQVFDGTLRLSEGAGALSGGIGEIKSQTPALIDGISELKNGAMQLSDGMKEFNEKGIQKLIEAFDGDLAGLASRIKVLSDVSKGYDSFSGSSKGVVGSVKFIYKTDSIEK